MKLKFEQIFKDLTSLKLVSDENTKGSLIQIDFHQSLKNLTFPRPIRLTDLKEDRMKHISLRDEQIKDSLA